MKQGFDDLIGFNFIEIYRKIHSSINRELLNDIGITFPQYRVISRLWLEEILTQKELCDLLSITPATLTAMIKILEQKNWIKRTGLKDDGRVKMIQLTLEGVGIRNRGFEVITRYENDNLMFLPEEERKLFLKWLKMFNDNLSI